MARMQVRPIAAHDAAEVDTVIRRWHGTNVDSYWYNDTHQNHTLEGARAFFLAEVLPTCEVLVALVDGVLAGMTALQAPWIMQMAVFAEYRRHGVGSALLAAARARSPAELRLFTFQRNHAARAFYERHGFIAQRLGTSPAPENEPDVEYAWFSAPH
ncbi:N-acetyltransferase family protein [Ideonella sp.]|uniref:GNAT family N-acetyltransferase n=1 Tax=Ideonella sp. TaxID=1929293 RepID=UPI0035B115B8